MYRTDSILLIAVVTAATAIPIFAAQADSSKSLPSHQLEGVVHDSNGKLVKGAEIWLMVPDPSGNISIDAHITDKNGRYFLAGDPPGNYALVVEDWTINPADSPVALTQGLLPEHDITVSKAAPISPKQKRTWTKNAVVVMFDVGKDGKAFNIKETQSSGNDDADQAALEAVRLNRYKPTTYNGQPTVSRVTHEFDIVQ